MLNQNTAGYNGGQCVHGYLPIAFSYGKPERQQVL